MTTSKAKSTWGYGATGLALGAATAWGMGAMQSGVEVPFGNFGALNGWLFSAGLSLLTTWLGTMVGPASATKIVDLLRVLLQKVLNIESFSATVETPDVMPDAPLEARHSMQGLWYLRTLLQDDNEAQDMLDRLTVKAVRASVRTE